MIKVQRQFLTHEESKWYKEKHQNKIRIKHGAYIIKKGLYTFFTTTNTIPESIHRRMNTYKYIRIYAVFFYRSLPLSSPCATKCEERSKPIC